MMCGEANKSNLTLSPIKETLENFNTSLKIDFNDTAHSIDAPFSLDLLNLRYFLNSFIKKVNF